MQKSKFSPLFSKTSKRQKYKTKTFGFSVQNFENLRFGGGEKTLGG